MANTPIQLPKHFTPGFSTTEKPTVSVEVADDIKSKFNYVWCFQNSIYDKDLINGLSFDPTYTEASGIKQERHGQCVDLSSTNTYTIYPAPTHSMSGATKATVLIVFKPDAINGNNLLFATDAGAGSEWANTIAIWPDNSGTNTSNANCVSVNFGTNTSARLEPAANSIAVGEWATVVVSYDGSGSVCVAVNGVTKTSLDSGTIPSSLGTPSRFELNGASALDNFDGKVAFLATSEDYAATEAECREWSSGGLYGYFLKPTLTQFAMTAGAAGGGTVTGSGSPTASTATASGAGVREIAGSGTPTATTATSSASGTITKTGSGAPQATTATTSGTGVREVTSSGSPQASTATSSGSGVITRVGSGAVQAETATSTGSGTIEGTVSGAGSPQAETATVSGTGVRTSVGTGSPQAETATSAGVGTAGNVISGSGTPQATTATANGVGLRLISGAGSPQAQVATASGAGVRTITGSASPQAQAATSTGVGLRVITGSGSPQASTATAIGYETGTTINTNRTYTVETENRTYIAETEDRSYQVA